MFMIDKLMSSSTLVGKALKKPPDVVALNSGSVKWGLELLEVQIYSLCSLDLVVYTHQIC